MAPTRVLITGATGFIGGSILSHLLSSNKEATRSLEISVLTRNDNRAHHYASSNLQVYTIQDLDDSAAITAAASENDIVIHAASGYHTPSAKALIEGLGERKRQNPNAEVYYIHTSGTSNLADCPITGTFVESRIFSDKDQDIYNYMKEREAEEKYAQRTTDLVVVETGKVQNVPTTIIMSPTIYGLGSGKFNRLTIQYPRQMRGALQEGRAEFVGDGHGTWDFVHILDLALLYEIVLLDWVEDRRVVPVGEQGIMFSGTGRFTWKEVAEGIAKAGVELGRFESADTRSITLEEAAKKWVGGDERLCELGFASNARTTAEIGRQLGWTPTRTRADWERSFRDELGEILKEDAA
ncbi:NAD(P)-binding protein [Thozetella sp. PMI_491]|nr:NAD(P)-binding protein [Thozetella sp. PMI_491]